MTVSFEVVEEPARAAAAMMVSAALGGGEIVLAGGSTPKAAYAQFVSAIKEVGFDPSQTRFWLGDERCVERGDKLSNFEMIEESLLRPLADIAEPDVHRIKGELGPQSAADDYEHQLRDAGPPRFDLVLLGIGPDAAAREVVFLVSGSAKADAVAAAFGPGSKPDPHVPSSMLVPEAERITVLMDADAAARLDLDSGSEQ
jgi:6-phosphogluconolactonase